MRITGVMVQYYKACWRELWFFANGINMDYESEDIAIGRLIHEKSYSREMRNINFGEGEDMMKFLLSPLIKSPLGKISEKQKNLKYFDS